MAQVTKTRTYDAGDQLTNAYYNDDRDEVIAGVNSISNAQIAANAAIASSKIADTLDNKTSTRGKITIGTTADSANIIIDLTTKTVHNITLAGNRTLSVTAGQTGNRFFVSFTQDGTGGRSVTWFDTITWLTADTSMNTTAGEKTLYGFLITGTDTYFGFLVGKEY